MVLQIDVGDLEGRLMIARAMRRGETLGSVYGAWTRDQCRDELRGTPMNEETVTQAEANANAAQAEREALAAAQAAATTTEGA